MNGFPSHSTGEKRKNQVEPEPPTDSGPRPPWLDEVAGAEWDRIAGTIRQLRIFTTLDRATLEAYCVAYARWREAEHLVITHGGLVIKKRGKITINPAFQVAHKCMDQMRRIAIEFGFTPVARSRISLKGKPSDVDDEFFDDPALKLPRPGEAKIAALEDKRGAK